MKINLRKSKVSYTVMIVSDSADRNPKTYHVRAGTAVAVGLFAFMLLTALICFVVYNSVITQSAMNRVKSQQEKIEQLEASCKQLQTEKNDLIAANDQMEMERNELTIQINKAHETLAEKDAEAELLAAAEQEKYIPSRFPFDGGASPKEETENRANTMQANEEQKEMIFTAAVGTNVISAGAGTILSIAPDEQLGNVVTIDHGNGYVSIYRNNSDPIVKTDSKVDAGAVLFVIGNNNQDTGYSIRKDNNYIDPVDILDIKG